MFRVHRAPQLADSFLFRSLVAFAFVAASSRFAEFFFRKSRAASSCSFLRSEVYGTGAVRCRGRTFRNRQAL